MRKIIITAGDVTATAILKDNPTADAIWKALPIEARANTWGDEIYFGIPVNIEEADDASDVVNMGELGYWPSGNAFCIFFGLTPASHNDEIRAALQGKEGLFYFRLIYESHLENKKKEGN